MKAELSGLLVAVLGGLSAVAQAQETEALRAPLEPPRPSQGYYYALGVHGGLAMASDSDRDNRRPTGGMGLSFGWGQTLTEWVSLGIGFAALRTSGDAADALSLFRFGLDTRWYPTKRWFGSAGVGLSVAQGQDPGDAESNRNRYGDVYHLGIGRHLYLTDPEESGGWTVTPIVTAEVGPEVPITTAALWLGVEISWWSGLPKRQLDLPVERAY